MTGCAQQWRDDHSYDEKVNFQAANYTEVRASLDADVWRENPCLSMGNAVSQVEAPFSWERSIQRWLECGSCFCRFWHPLLTGLLVWASSRLDGMLDFMAPCKWDRTIFLLPYDVNQHHKGAKKAVKSHVLICIIIPSEFLDCDCYGPLVCRWIPELLIWLIKPKGLSALQTGCNAHSRRIVWTGFNLVQSSLIASALVFQYTSMRIQKTKSGRGFVYYAWL